MTREKTPSSRNVKILPEDLSADSEKYKFNNLLKSRLYSKKTGDDTKGQMMTNVKTKRLVTQNTMNNMDIVQDAANNTNQSHKMKGSPNNEIGTCNAVRANTSYFLYSLEKKYHQLKRRDNTKKSLLKKWLIVPRWNSRLCPKSISDQQLLLNQ